MSEMRPKRYPYSGKRKNLDNSTTKGSSIKAVDIMLDKSCLSFKKDKIVINGQSIISV